MLRGINIGSTNRVAMSAFKDLLRGLGYEDVVTYLQSGNAVFKTPFGGTTGIARQIRDRIACELGLELGVIVRSRAEITKTATSNPFMALDVETKLLHVTFLAISPSPDARKSVDPNGYRPDKFEVSKREVFLYVSGGYGRTKLNNSFWERKFKTAATTRNWNTVTNLVELANR